MSKKEDLRGLILPTVLVNTDQYYSGNESITSTNFLSTNLKSKEGNPDFNTTDLVFLDGYEDLYRNRNLTNMDRRVAPTDYAIMNHAQIREGASTIWLRSAASKDGVYCLDSNRKIYESFL